MANTQLGITQEWSHTQARERSQLLDDVTIFRQQDKAAVKHQTLKV